MPRLEPEPISPGLHRLNPLSLPPKLLIRPLQGLYPHPPPRHEGLYAYGSDYDAQLKSPSASSNVAEALGDLTDRRLR